MLTEHDLQEIEDVLSEVNKACHLRIDRASFATVADFGDCIADKLRERADFILGFAFDVEELCFAAFAMESGNSVADVAEGAP